jgi:hypothetical protein
MSFLTVFLRVLESDYYEEALLLDVGRLRSLLLPGGPVLWAGYSSADAIVQ